MMTLLWTWFLDALRTARQNRQWRQREALDRDFYDQLRDLERRRA